MEVGLSPASQAFKEMLIIGGIMLIAVFIAVFVIAALIRRGRRY